MKQIDQPFEELMIPRREMQGVSAMRYRVYRDIKSYKLVEATSALEALTRSGISKAYKIERHNPMGDNIIQFGQPDGNFARENIAEIKVSDVVATISQIMPDQELAQEEQVAVEEERETVEISLPTPVEKPAEVAPLSNEEIERLLNG